MAGLTSIEHLVVLMLENRSLDHMLGYLYADAGNTSPAGDPFEGLSGDESCPGTDGEPVAVHPLTSSTDNLYFMPGADPAEGYTATNDQLFGDPSSPTPQAIPTMKGFVTSFAQAITDDRDGGWYVFPGTNEQMIMGCHTPQTLPILSSLAAGFAVCDHWFASAPTQTMPNRAFVAAGTSQGRMDDRIKRFTCPSIFGALTEKHMMWKIYGDTASPLTKLDFDDTRNASAEHFGLLQEFRADAAAGNLPAYAFLEPSWSASGNSEHPNYNVALGEQLLHTVYRAVRDGIDWPTTLLIITYDEHGGCFDHVPPPWGAVPPDTPPQADGTPAAGEFGFDFTRFGPRVPTLLISPLIPAGRVFRTTGATPLDHTSILATIERRWQIDALTARDAAAPDVGAALTLETPRTDDPLADVQPPPAPADPPGLTARKSHLEAVREQLLAQG